MNNLSWFLYVADVLPSIGKTMVFFTVMWIGALLFWVLFASLTNLDLENKDDHVPYPSKANFMWLFAVLLLVSLIPAKETIYLIAGSEAGEYVAESDTGQAILSDVQEIIQIQLEALKESD